MDRKKSNAVPIEESPEVKSFIYQQIADFEPFLTESSLISVISKNQDDFGYVNDPSKHTISISIKENGVSLEEEGTSENIYEAILEAKNKLFKKLVSIQDSVISQKDRLAQILSAKSNVYIH
ncbi:MAG: hypothetical protein RJB66_705 [Pseudomonadota bacterium]|jgi:ribosome-associated translation inhibitor RaiA